MDGKTFTASTGVVFRVKPVSVFVLDAVQRRLPAPEVPRQEIEDKNGKKRMEENPSHPAYIAAVERWQRESAECVEDALIYLGTSVESVPSGFDGPEATDWAAQLAFIGLPVSDDDRHRYLCWVKYWAIRTAPDMVALTRAVRDATLTPEVAVVAAAESFRSGA